MNRFERFRERRAKYLLTFDEAAGYYESVYNVPIGITMNPSDVGGSQLYRSAKPTPSDFICDFELAAKRVLDAFSLKQFKAMVQEGATLSAKDEYKIKFKVGEELFKRGIYPAIYFRYVAKPIRGI